MSLLPSQRFPGHSPLPTSLPLCFAHLGHRRPSIAVHPFGARWKPFSRSLSFASRAPAIFAASTSNEELLQALVGFDSREDQPRTHLPALRTYENDLTRFTLIGAVNVDQAVTAAAADGGDAAEEHLSSGLSTMVIETVYPGSSAHSTVSTRLFLPSREVKERAKQMRANIADDLFSGSRNILAMTFRQVTLHRVLSFELDLFSPGSQRDMEDLSNPRAIPSEISISSENLPMIAALSEAICSCVLECTKQTYLKNQKPRKFLSSDSTVSLIVIPREEIIKTARTRFNEFIPRKGIREEKHGWWARPTIPQLDSLGGIGFGDWTNEYIPAYRLQINGENMKDVKVKGGQILADGSWEVLLTHFQVVELADIFDMYYEDLYTLPNKRLPSSLISPVSNGAKNMGKFSWKFVSAIVLGCCLLISLRVIARIGPHNLFEAKISSLEPAASTSDSLQPLILGHGESEALCLSVVQRILIAFGRHEDVSLDKDVGAWAGQLPTFVRKLNNLENPQQVLERESSTGLGEAPVHSSERESSTAELSPSHENSEVDMTSSTQDISSYQVVLSRDGKVLGFQPTSRTAVPHWASNPLAEALHEGMRLSPGILEPTVKISRPQEVVLVELLMSVNPGSWFVLARPMQ